MNSNSFDVNIFLKVAALLSDLDEKLAFEDDTIEFVKVGEAVATQRFKDLTPFMANMMLASYNKTKQNKTEQKKIITKQK